MGFNSMFSSLAGEGENSDRIFTKNGVKIKYMSGKQPITFAIMPALDPSNPDRSVSYLPSILPGDQPTLSDWGKGVFVYRGIGHGEWKDRCDVVCLTSVGEEFCPLEAVFKTAKNDPTWSYLTEDQGKFGDKDRIPATLPSRRLLLFCNVMLMNDQDKSAHIGIFTKSVANKLIGDNGLVFQPSPSATEEQVRENYLAAYAMGDITSPQGAPAFIVEKGHDKGEMSGYDIRMATDASRRVLRTQFTRDVLATRYNIADPREYLNILTPDQIVQLLIRELSGRSPAGYHEYALLKLALGSRFQIPEPPSAPGAMSTVPSGFTPPPAPAEAAPAPTGVPVSTIMPTATPPSNANTSAAQPATPAATVSMGNEADAALASAVKAGVAVPPPAPAAPGAGHVPGDPVPAFDKAAFLARLAKGGNQ